MNWIWHSLTTTVNTDGGTLKCYFNGVFTVQFAISSLQATLIERGRLLQVLACVTGVAAKEDIGIACIILAILIVFGIILCLYIRFV